jgi:hypothetical protein
MNAISNENIIGLYYWRDKRDGIQSTIKLTSETDQEENNK